MPTANQREIFERPPKGQGLTLVHLSAQPEPFF